MVMALKRYTSRGDKEKILTAFYLDIYNEATTAFFNVSPLYRKKAIVQAVQLESSTSIEVEAIHTSDSIVREVPAGKWIVATDDGQHSVSHEKFISRYEETEEGYRPKGTFRAFQNPLGQYISVITSWGGQEQGNEVCFLVALCDDETLEATAERHLVGYDEFVLEYEKIPEEEPTEETKEELAADNEI